jgi:hypothetical protein
MTGLPMDERQICWTKGLTYEQMGEFFETDAFTEKYLHYEFIKQEINAI